MAPTAEWLQLYEKKRLWLRCPNDLNAYFTSKEICHKSIDQISLGKISIPTGEVLARDPLTYMSRDQQPYFQKVPAGEYEAEACVIRPSGYGGAHYAAVRIRFTNRPAKYHEEALTGDEDLVHLKKGEYFGFNVEAGLACVCDVKVRDAFCDFVEEWERERPGDNIYEDYFSSLFVLNSRMNPRYQRNGGDWINWKIPNTEYRLPIFESGFGDGAYPMYYGYDARGKICQIVVQFIDIELAYQEHEQEHEQETIE